MRLCSYVVVYDTGFAPNPFWGFCTLAACTPNRQGVRLGTGDWLVGHSTLGQGQKLIYAMRVSEVLDFDAYYTDERFAEKHPRVDRSWREAAGDNIYHRAEDGTWLQDYNRSHGRDFLRQDTRHPRVYVSDHFYYFGENAVAIPSAFTELIRARQGCRCRFSAELTTGFVSWLEASYSPGIHGEPRDRIREAPPECAPKREQGSCGDCA